MHEENLDNSKMVCKIEFLVILDLVLKVSSTANHLLVLIAHICMNNKMGSY